MKCIHRPGTLLAIKQHQILNWLLPIPQDINNILGQLATQERRNRRNLAAEVLAETAQELCGEGLRWKQEFFVFEIGYGGEELELVFGLRGVLA